MSAARYHTQTHVSLAKGRLGGANGGHPILIETTPVKSPTFYSYIDHNTPILIETTSPKSWKFILSFIITSPHFDSNQFSQLADFLLSLIF
jgi:hypothetical protein